MNNIVSFDCDLRASMSTSSAAFPSGQQSTSFGSPFPESDSLAHQVGTLSQRVSAFVSRGEHYLQDLQPRAVNLVSHPENAPFAGLAFRSGSLPPLSSHSLQPDPNHTSLHDEEIERQMELDFLQRNVGTEDVEMAISSSSPRNQITADRRSFSPVFLSNVSVDDPLRGRGTKRNRQERVNAGQNNNVEKELNATKALARRLSRSLSEANTRFSVEQTQHQATVIELSKERIQHQAALTQLSEVKAQHQAALTQLSEERTKSGNAMAHFSAANAQLLAERAASQNTIPRRSEAQTQGQKTMVDYRDIIKRVYRKYLESTVRPSASC